MISALVHGHAAAQLSVGLVQRMVVRVVEGPLQGATKHSLARKVRVKTVAQPLLILTMTMVGIRTRMMG